MSYSISKELFEAVMELKVAKIVVSNHMGDENRIHYSAMGREFSGSVLINAFFFKCKEWLDIKYSDDVVIYKNEVLFIYNLYAEAGIFCIESFEKDSIQQSLFDACQWILDNKDKQ